MEFDRSVHQCRQDGIRQWRDFKMLHAVCSKTRSLYVKLWNDLNMKAVSVIFFDLLDRRGRVSYTVRYF